MEQMGMTKAQCIDCALDSAEYAFNRALRQMHVEMSYEEKVVFRKVMTALFQYYTQGEQTMNCCVCERALVNGEMFYRFGKDKVCHWCGEQKSLSQLSRYVTLPVDYVQVVFVDASDVQ